MHTDKEKSGSFSYLCPSVPHLWLIPLLLFPSLAVAQSKWTLTTADFQKRQVDLAGIDDAGALVSDAAGAAQRQIKWEDLLLFERETENRPAAGKFIVYLAGGDRVRGAPLKLDGETLRWNASA